MNNQQKLYSAMTPDEQFAWVNEFTDLSAPFTVDRGTATANRRHAAPVVSIKPLQRLFTLLSAWPFAQDFCDKARRYGDYMARIPRLPIYIEKVHDALADGLTTTDAKGRRLAVILPGAPVRRRGRPTKEETAARLRGEVLADFGQGNDSPEARKRRAIARMLGIDVIPGEPVREKNNAELAADRAARAAEEAKRNPSLFGGDAAAEHTGGKEAQGTAAPASAAPASPAVHSAGVVASASPACSVPPGSAPASPVGSVPAGSASGSSPSPCAQLQSDAYELRMAQDRLHINQLSWLLSPALAKRTETIQSLRVTAESASERAKTMADLGQPAAAVATYSQQAKEATEAYLAIYADVDEELAVLHKRLYLDLPFIEKFKTRFNGVDVEKIQYITRPYYEKVRKADPAIDARVKLAIETDNPEYAARMKAEEEKKQEIADILRYLKRKDKPNVAQRIKTMEKRYARLIELLGETEASTYRPIVDAAIADYEQNHKKPEPATVVSDSVADKKKPAKKTAGKTAATTATKKTTTKPTKK